MNTVLIVEDEVNVRENLKDLLQEEGFDVLTANDGSEGYKVAIEFLPDIIISDIRMPNMDGLELLKLLQKGKETSQIPFLFLTAKVEIKDFREGMNIGADDYIMKPYKTQELLNAINLRLLKKEHYCEGIKDIKEQFIARIPHELRTPLVGIIGFSDILKNEVHDLPVEDVKRMAGVINHSGKRLYKRIEKLLEYSELLAFNKDELIGKNYAQLSYELEPLSLIKELKKSLKEEDRSSDIKISFEECNVKIHERYYKTIIHEIIENSIKFSKKGSKIVITGNVEGNYYRTLIHDQGFGMDKKSQSKIDSFNQFSKDTYSREGLGIGLALVRKTLKMFDGYLKVESKEGQYTKVEFGIPHTNMEISK